MFLNFKKRMHKIVLNRFSFVSCFNFALLVYQIWHLLGLHYSNPFLIKNVIYPRLKFLGRFKYPSDTIPNSMSHFEIVSVFQRHSYWKY